MAISQEEKVRRNTEWKKTPDGQKSQKKVIENITVRRKLGTYGKGGGDLSHPRQNKKGEGRVVATHNGKSFTMAKGKAAIAGNRGGKGGEKKMIASRNKKGYSVKYA